METIDNKYANSKIYKLISQTHPELVYYGSTIQKLCVRMCEHRRDFKNNKNVRSKKVMQFEDVQIILVINFDCHSKEELTALEADYIRDNECVNKNKTRRTYKQYREDNKAKIIQYQEVNKEKNKDYLKQYREDNDEQIKEKVKQYYLENKSKLREKRVKYLENNKDEINLHRRNKYKENKLVKKE